jgi:hypothetical protein
MKVEEEKKELTKNTQKVKEEAKIINATYANNPR